MAGRDEMLSELIFAMLIVSDLLWATVFLNHLGDGALKLENSLRSADRRTLESKCLELEEKQKRRKWEHAL